VTDTLHWAAVNNVDTLTILLQHDVNKDAQDCHDQTPLFLAAREGSCEEAVKQLLKHGANIADLIDRLPRHVAHERMHIVSLLDDYDPIGRRFHVSSSDGVMPTACVMGNDKQKKASSVVMLQGRGRRTDLGASVSPLPSGGSSPSPPPRPQVHAARLKVAAESMGSSTMMPLLDVKELVSASGSSGGNFELRTSNEIACTKTPVLQQGTYLPDATVSEISCGMQQMAAAAGSGSRASVAPVTHIRSFRTCR
jgi:hypothetical protein